MSQLSGLCLLSFLFIKIWPLFASKLCLETLKSLNQSQLMLKIPLSQHNNIQRSQLSFKIAQQSFLNKTERAETVYPAQPSYLNKIERAEAVKSAQLQFKIIGVFSWLVFISDAFRHVDIFKLAETQTIPIIEKAVTKIAGR